MNELKPCPFCGDDAVLVELSGHEESFFYVHCQSCAAETEDHVSAASAVEHWNARPVDDKLQGRIDALEWLIEVDEFCESSYYNELSADGEDELYAIHLAALAAVDKK